MIPKVIHYCWFGNNPLPEEAVKCIESWKKFFPEYEIKEWNEENFDLECCDYVKEATKIKKWAYVSDFARMKILYENGGIYLDVDVEIIKRFDDIIEKGPYLGCERGEKIAVNTGLGFGAEAGSELIREIMDTYMKDHFLDSHGNPIFYTVVDRVTNILKGYGLKESEKIQHIKDFDIYPADFFCPMDYKTGEMDITENTKTIHWYTASWFPADYLRRRKKAMKIRRKVGGKKGFLVAWVYMKSSGLVGKIRRVLRKNGKN